MAIFGNDAIILMLKHQVNIPMSIQRDAILAVFEDFLFRNTLRTRLPRGFERVSFFAMTGCFS